MPTTDREIAHSTSSIIRLLLLALYVLPVRAEAADLPVSYLVAEKPLRSAAAGTSLAFELFSDGACSVPAQTVPVAVEDVTILSRLKQVTPRNDSKLPATVELRTTLAGVTAVGPLYLRVTAGGSIVPVGGACQVQSAAIVVGPAGPPGPEGASGAPGTGALVKDANGAVIGVPFYDPCDNGNVLYDAGGSAVRLRVNVTSFAGTGCAYFSGPNCTGTVAVDAPGNCLGAGSAVLGTTLYYVAGSLASLPYQSVSCHNDCANGSGVNSMYPGASAPLGGFVPPFALRFD